MVFKKALEEGLKAYILFRVKDKSHNAKEVAKDTGVSLASIYRIRKESIGGFKKTKKRSTGRPRKINARMERNMMRQLKVLRKEDGNWTSGKLMEMCDINNSEISNRTVRRQLNRNGYEYLQARKKGLLTEKDIAKRLEFAKDVEKTKDPDFWTNEIAFYLDGVSFYYKRNPAGQARAPKGRVWRKISEGLAQGCTAKGRKEGSGGKVLKLFVSISYNKGVIACHPYEKLDGAFLKST